MSGTNGKSARASAAQILTPYADTPVKKRAVERLATSSVRADDVPVLDALEDIEALTPGQRRIVQQVRRATWILPIREERRDDPGLLQRIAEQAAAVEARRLAADVALEARVLAAQAVAKAQTPDQQERRLAALRMAQEDHRLAHEALERATSLLTDLYRERDERHRAAMLDAHTTT